MTTEDFDRAVNGIRPELIEEAAHIEPVPVKKGRILKLVAAAAALILCVGASAIALPYIIKPSGGTDPETTAESGVGAGGVLEGKEINLGNGNISLTTIMEARDGMPSVRIKEAEAEELTVLLSKIELQIIADPKQNGESGTDTGEGYVIYLENGDTVELYSAGYLKIGESYYTDDSGNFSALYEKTAAVLSGYYRK